MLVPAMIGIAAIILAIILFILLNSWLTYTNNQYGFQFMYPRDFRLTDYAGARESLAAEIDFSNPPEDRFDKHLEIIVNQSGVQYPCQVEVNEREWVFKSLYIEGIAFSRATKLDFDQGTPGYEIYFTNRDGSSWVCLVFSYIPRGLGPDQTQLQPSDAEAARELEIFYQIAKTFRWLPPPPPVTTTTPPIAIITTPPTVEKRIPVIPTTVTPSDTPSPTSTYPPTPTWTSTPCVPNPAWVTYIVQPGDNLFRISQWYSGITVADLLRANCKVTPDIRSGETLYVPRTPPPASITGYVFSDPNYNRVQDPGEQRLRNVPVTLMNASGQVIDTTVTNMDGVYQFSNLPYGLYQIFQYYIYVRPNQTIQRNFGVAPVP